MKRFFSRPLSFLAALLASALPLVGQRPAKVEPVKHPFLWRIEGETVQWLYGTMHLADKRITTLPDSVDAAIDTCDVLLTELEMDAKTQAMLAKATRLEKGKTLADVLPEATYARLEKYLASKNMPIAAVAGQKPWVIVAMLPLLDDLKAMMSGKALDMLIADEAKDRGKRTGALETPEEQIGAFESFTDAEIAAMCDGTLDLLEKAAAENKSMLQELIGCYLGGDLEVLEEYMDSMSGLDGQAELEAKFKQRFLDDRNKLMVDRLLERMAKEPKVSHFVAVGAAHYAGKTGILALLKARGYEITRVGGDPPKKVKAEAREPAGVGRGR